MLRLGCIEAVNLDGGGSTTLNLFGMTVNRPSGGVERAVANAILFQRLGAAPPRNGNGNGNGHDAPKLRIRGPESMKLGQAARFDVVDGSGRTVDARQVVWSVSNGAWIDQGGILRPLKEGLASVAAWIGGRVLVAAVEVLPSRAP
jgi:exopolysaccharide biosynthesis protein